MKTVDTWSMASCRAKWSVIWTVFSSEVTGRIESNLTLNQIESFSSPANHPRLPSGAGLPRLSWKKRPSNGCLSGSGFLQVNGHDLTMATHKKAVEYISRKPVLNLLVYRKGMPQLPPKQAPPPHQMSSSYQSYPAGYRQQQPVSQLSPASQPYYRQNWLADFTTKSYNVFLVRSLGKSLRCLP